MSKERIIVCSLEEQLAKLKVHRDLAKRHKDADYYWWLCATIQEIESFLEG